MKQPQKKDEKLLVECRVEGGCLGPDGASHVDDFCYFSEVEFRDFHGDKINWKFVRRENSLKPEVEYKIIGKTLSRQQAKKYLGLFDIDLAEFESEIDDRLISLIERYMGV